MAPPEVPGAADRLTAAKRKQEESSSIDANAIGGRIGGPAMAPPKVELVAFPVTGNSSGEGLPYAPEGWPRPGDVWRWKVKNRKTTTGYWADRFLYPPPGFPKIAGGFRGFWSMCAIRDYLQKEFPLSNADAFFASFLWRVPAGEFAKKKGLHQSQRNTSYRRRADIKRDISTDAAFSMKAPKILKAEENPMVAEATFEAGSCKAGNKKCAFQIKEESSCDLCCSGSSFCRNCCCILCSKPIDNAYGGYSYIRCQATTREKFICGHAAHLSCALRSFMAGTVGGSINLDVEYYCRRCDNKTDLLPHVSELLKTSKCVDVHEDVVKMLNLGICILRGSEQARAKNLQDFMESTIAKLKCRVPPDDLWNVEDDSTSVTPGGLASPISNDISRSIGYTASSNGHPSSHANVAASEGNRGRARGPIYIVANHCDISSKLDEVSDTALRELKASQESVYEVVRRKLSSQKGLLINLYRQLDRERAELAALNGGGDLDPLLGSVLARVDRIKFEEAKLRGMMSAIRELNQVATGLLGKYF